MRVRRLLAHGAGVGLASALVAVPVPPAHAVDVECSGIQHDARPVPQSSKVSTPLDLLHVREAQQLFLREGRRPGAGVGVAVLDSGIAPGPYTVTQRVNLARGQELLYYHGTAVAGLIAGAPRPGNRLTGVAPAARLYDVRVFDEPDPGDPSRGVGVTTAQVVRGLDWVAANARRLGIGVANVSLEVPHTPALAAAVRRVHEAGVVIVASAGNRERTEGSEFTPGSGEDAADEVFPAGYDEVIAVSATTAGLPDGGDARTFVLQNSATDIAAPTFGAVSVAANGGTCVLSDGVYTSWSAALVSGVVALLRARYPQESVDQITTRLLASASGRIDARTPTTGAGVVQPVDALMREFETDRQGRLPQTVEVADEEPPAVAPQAEADRLATLRRHALWWGLAGGGALVVSLLLRPLLARRRA